MLPPLQVSSQVTGVVGGIASGRPDTPSSNSCKPHPIWQCPQKLLRTALPILTANGVGLCCSDFRAYLRESIIWSFLPSEKPVADGHLLSEMVKVHLF